MNWAVNSFVATLTALAVLAGCSSPNTQLTSKLADPTQIDTCEDLRDAWSIGESVWAELRDSDMPWAQREQERQLVIRWNFTMMHRDDVLRCWSRGYDFKRPDIEYSEDDLGSVPPSRESR